MTLIITLIVGLVLLGFIYKTIKKRNALKKFPKEAISFIAKTKPEAIKDIQKLDLQTLPPPTEIGGNNPAFKNIKESYDVNDLGEFLGAYGTINPSWDLDGSGGKVNVADLSILLAKFGVSVGRVYDIIPAWNNFYNHLSSDNQTAGFDAFIRVQDEDTNWSDIKDDCDIEWIYQGAVASTNKEVCPIFEAVTNVGLCSGQFPLTLKITHNPSGKIYERRACTHINLTVGDGWFEVNPNLTDCAFTECPTTVENLFSGDFEEYQFLVN